jgi:Histidine kinase-, DNA gyrase B-, and HSP90-like ATPase
LPSKEKFIVTQIPPAADDLSARGHRSARRRGPLRRLFGRRDHDDDLDPSLDWAAPQADEPDDDSVIPAGVPTYRAQHRSDLADAAIPVPPVAPVGEAEATPDPEDSADGDLLYQVLGGLALRDLTLVESLLQVVEKLESNEQNPGQLELLFRIDHLATRMRRNSENLLVLAGHDPQGRELEPVPLLDVARAAVSEITDYSRVQISPLPDLEVMGVAADDLSHILAELLENATSKSPESAAVVIRAERTGDGTIVISVEDSGIGIPPDQLADLNARLSRAPVVDPTVTRHMGLYVVGRLAQRHGIRIQLRERPYGGLIAHVVTPARLVRTGPDAQPRPARGPATKPQPAVPPSGPRLTAVRSPHPGPPGTPGTPPQQERPAPPPAAAPGRPMTPPAPRFAPADPSMLPQRTPSRGAAAGPRPSAPPPSAPLTGPPLASPQPPAETPGTEAPAARADRIRDDLTDFRLGQNEARAAGRQNGTEAGPA